MSERALSGIRVIEFCDEIGSYCGRLLADLGAEVIKIEPPGGGRERLSPPHIAAAGASVDTSLAFWVHNTSKKSVVLDLESEFDLTQARRLATTADIILEDYPVGYLGARGLGYEKLKPKRPALVYTSVTGFGETGPHASWAYSDLIGQATGGVMTLAGDPDDPPNTIYGNQANISASIHAAQGTLLALLHAEATGQGQRVDTSAQEAISISQETAMQTWDMQRTNKIRSGSKGMLPIDVPAFGTYEAADGYVFLFILAPGGEDLPALVAWMAEQGLAEGLEREPLAEVVESLNMETLTALMSGAGADLASKVTQLSEIDTAIRKFIKTMPARVIYEEGQARRLLIGLVSNPADIAANSQLRARDWFLTLEVDQAVTIEFPGPPYRLSETPAEISDPPALGEHTDAVLAQLQSEVP